MTRFLSNLFGTRTPAARAQPVRRLGLESLETREVPAIDLVGSQVNVICDSSNDRVTVGTDVAPDGTPQVVVTRLHYKETVFGTTPFYEIKKFDWDAVDMIYVDLGDGENTFSSTAAKRTAVVGGAGGDHMTGANGTDIFIGGGGDDTLLGGGGKDHLYGGDANDLIVGGSGDDFVYGGSGNDFIYGGSGNDQLHGENGNDRIYGQDGDDTLSGGDGNDHLDGGTGLDAVDGGPGSDTVA
jgi:Ca2+-binding RTX toxin-like protein